jgi:hypothetical protein
VQFLYGHDVLRLNKIGNAIDSVAVMPISTSASGKKDFILKADAIVVACGSYSAPLLRSVGVDLPIYPGKGYSATFPLLKPEGAPMVSTIDDGKMYIVSKKKSVADKEAKDPTLTVCDAKTMEVIAQINTILNADGTAAADGRAFLPVKELGKGFLSTTEGVFTFNLDDNTVGSLIAGTDGLANNQTGNMVYADGKVYAVDQHRGLLVIDAAEGKLLKTVKGIGLKTAQRIIVDLKDKIASVENEGTAAPGTSATAATGHSEILEEAVAALTMLGFPPAPSQKVALAILKEEPEAAVERVIKLALKRL